MHADGAPTSFGRLARAAASLGCAAGRDEIRGLKQDLVEARAHLRREAVCVSAGAGVFLVGYGALVAGGIAWSTQWQPPWVGAFAGAAISFGLGLGIVRFGRRSPPEARSRLGAAAQALSERGGPGKHGRVSSSTEGAGEPRDAAAPHAEGEPGPPSRSEEERSAQGADRASAHRAAVGGCLSRWIEARGGGGAPALTAQPNTRPRAGAESRDLGLFFAGCGAFVVGAVLGAALPAFGRAGRGSRYDSTKRSFDDLDDRAWVVDEVRSFHPRDRD